MDSSRALACFAALGHKTRLDVFRLLVAAGDAGMPAGRIAAELGVLQNTLSVHLAALADCGLIRGEREGRVIRYRAGMAALRDLVAFLMEDCCGGRPGLCAPMFDAVTSTQGDRS